MEDLLESNQTWKAFLIDYYQPYIHKINIELGGYHPKTKKETKVEDDELIMFYNQKNKEIEDAKPKVKAIVQVGIQKMLITTCLEIMIIVLKMT